MGARRRMAALEEPMRPIQALTKPSRSAVVVTVGDVTLTLSTDEADALLAQLGGQRARMRPTLSGEPPSGEELTETETAIFYDVRYDPTNDLFLLQLRHSGHGWLAWELDQPTAKEIRAALDAKP